MTPAAPRLFGLRGLADCLLTVVFAPRCVCCGAPHDHPTRGPACDACWSSVLPVPLPLCDACGEPVPAGLGDGVPVCERCRRRTHPLARVRSAGLYEGALRDIVHAFKYDGRRSLAVPLAALMTARGTAALTGADAAVAVPLHPWRRRERGFNQAHDLAVGLGLPVVRALRRVRATPPQANLPAAERQRNVSGAFAAGRQARALGSAVVVLVDDVMTTGATLEACARVLRHAGVREVRALTAARAARPPR